MLSLSARGVRFLDADWDGEEPDVAVTEISLSIDRNRFSLRSRILVDGGVNPQQSGEI